MAPDDVRKWSISRDHSPRRRKKSSYCPDHFHGKVNVVGRAYQSKWDLCAAVHKELYGVYYESLLTIDRQGVQPEEVGQTILKGIEARKPRTRYRVGFDAHVSWLVSKLPPRLRGALANRIIKSYALKPKEG
jgi:hypothetical protein